MTLQYDPFDEAIRNDPLPVYKRLRDEAPAYYMEKYDAWALSRFQDIWDALSTDAFSAARGTTPAQLLTKDQPVTPMLNVMDPPSHTQLRSVIRRCFLPKNVRAVEPIARKLVGELLDEAAGRDEFDAIGDFSARLSVTIACIAIGLPIEDGPMLTKLVQRFFHHDPGEEGMTEAGMAALGELSAYCEDMIKARRKQPSAEPAAIDALASFELGGKLFSDADAGSHVSMLVIGGSETFPKVFASGLMRLAEYPDQREQLVQDPTGIPDAFNEILRYDMPTQFLGRTLTRDMEFHGKTLKKDQAVIFLYASANKDDREFDDPDTFDILRRAPRFLSFSAGNHQCLGTHVARMEGKVCFEAFLSRFPEYELDLDRAVRLKTEFVQGFASLPVRNLR
ncbi:MAG: cytochrome P450 [Deltaproteobacteria bacterium]|nr:cytochrome P450 [Deltaproteobacteria bacterium]MBW2396761.1 cytochrome P450 [Deltaproteobacteria bacterium]